MGEPLGRRSDVLRVLKAAHSPMSIATLAEALDVHPDTVRFHLDTLVGTGRVERVTADRKGPGRPAHSGRASHTIHGGHALELRQTVVALASGHELAEHDSPGEATLQVLQGHVRLTAGDETWEGKAGDYVTIPAHRHSLRALEDSVVVLIVVKDIPSA